MYNVSRKADQKRKRRLPYFRIPHPRILLHEWRAFVRWECEHVQKVLVRVLVRILVRSQITSTSSCIQEQELHTTSRTRTSTSTKYIPWCILSMSCQEHFVRVLRTRARRSTVRSIVLVRSTRTSSCTSTSTLHAFIISVHFCLRLQLSSLSFHSPLLSIFYLCRQGICSNAGLLLLYSYDYLTLNAVHMAS